MSESDFCESTGLSIVFLGDMFVVGRHAKGTVKDESDYHPLSERSLAGGALKEIVCDRLKLQGEFTMEVLAFAPTAEQAMNSALKVLNSSACVSFIVNA
jgi:hypothetical protein